MLQCCKQCCAHWAPRHRLCTRGRACCFLCTCCLAAMINQISAGQRFPEMFCVQPHSAPSLASYQRGPSWPFFGAPLKRCPRRTITARALAIQAPVTSGSPTAAHKSVLLRAINSIYTQVSSFLPLVSRSSDRGHLKRPCKESACSFRNLWRALLPPTTPSRVLSSIAQAGKSSSVLGPCFCL